MSFVSASLLAFRYTNALVRAFYRTAAVWMGLLSFLFIASLLAWMIFITARLTGAGLNFHPMVDVLFAGATLIGVLGVFNASWTRITRATIRLANLPDAWRGRKAALISDLHLGHVRSGNFLRRMITKMLEESPNAIFIAGDLHDGTRVVKKSSELKFSSRRTLVILQQTTQSLLALYRCVASPLCRSPR